MRNTVIFSVIFRFFIVGREEVRRARRGEGCCTDLVDLFASMIVVVGY